MLGFVIKARKLCPAGTVAKLDAAGNPRYSPSGLPVCAPAPSTPTETPEGAIVVGACPSGSVKDAATGKCRPPTDAEKAAAAAPKPLIAITRLHNYTLTASEAASFKKVRERAVSIRTRASGIPEAYTRGRYMTWWPVRQDLNLPAKNLGAPKVNEYNIYWMIERFINLNAQDPYSNRPGGPWGVGGKWAKFWNPKQKVLVLGPEPVKNNLHPGMGISYTVSFYGIDDLWDDIKSVACPVASLAPIFGPEGAVAGAIAQQFICGGAPSTSATPTTPAVTPRIAFYHKRKKVWWVYRPTSTGLSGGPEDAAPTGYAYDGEFPEKPVDAQDGGVIDDPVYKRTGFWVGIAAGVAGLGSLTYYLIKRKR